MPLPQFVSTHKLPLTLTAIILGLLWYNYATSQPNFSKLSLPSAGLEMAMDTGVVSSRAGSSSFAPIYPEPDYAPSTSPNRLVITNTNLSLLVNDVEAALTSISTAATDQGGFLITSNLSVPEGAASGTISVRIPSDKLDGFLSSIKNLAVKVVSQTVSGTDVTDQYQDLEEQLRLLNTTKAKYTQILDQATRVQDILEVQQQLTSIQNQIDSTIGRQTYLEKSASLSRVDIYLSTDELALPYAPSEAWRPQLVFKQAVRSLIQNLRSVANLGITAAVYSVVALPLLLIVLVVYLGLKRRQPRSRNV